MKINPTYKRYLIRNLWIGIYIPVVYLLLNIIAWGML